MSGEAVLTVNTGSSSIKLAAYQVEAGKLGEQLLKAHLSGLPNSPRFSAGIAGQNIDDVPDSVAAAGPSKSDMVRLWPSGRGSNWGKRPSWVWVTGWCMAGRILPAQCVPAIM